jgi:hypothetical protein
LVDILVQEIRAGNPYLATRKKMDALIDWKLRNLITTKINL